MSEIVLNEKKWAKEAIDSLSLGNKPYETIVRVAKYYKSKGYNKGELRKQIEHFMLRCDSNISLIKWDKSIDAAIATADKYPMVCIDGVSIADEEMSVISSLDSKLQQRLLFTLICLAKYGNAVNPKNNNWVNRPQSEIFKLANINLTNRRQSLMINDLWRAGMVEYSKQVDNTNLRVTALRDGNICLTISDFRNLGNQYMRFVNHGDGYFECDVCGITLKQRVHNQKYCDVCAKEVDRSMAKDRMVISNLKKQIFADFEANSDSTPG